MQITWDLIILASLAVGTIYGMFLGRNKILGALVNLLLAFTFSVATGEFVYGFVADLGFVSSRFAVNQFGVSTVVIVVIFALLLFKSETAGLDSGGTTSQLQGGIYGFLFAGLALSALLSFMTEVQRISLDSNFANLVYSYRLVWVAAPILIMIGSAFLKRK